MSPILAVDLFPRTRQKSDINLGLSSHVETVVLLSKGEVDSKMIRVEFSLEDMDMSEFQDGQPIRRSKTMCWSIAD